jgi:CP family cyanate transporter-like MFS transporter
MVARRWPVVVAGAMTVIAAAGFLLGGVWVVVFAGVLGFSTATVFVLTIALPPLLVAEHDVHRLSAAIFTITYACPFVISLIGGAVWDASGVPYSSFLPIAATGVIMIGLVYGLDLSAAAKGRDVVTEERGDRSSQHALAGDRS